MDVEILLSGDKMADELRSLRTWLLDEPEFRGRVSLREPPPEPGTMPGGVVDAVVLTLAGGAAGMAAALVRSLGSIMIAWLNSRHGDVEATLTTTGGGTYTVTATNVRGLDAGDVDQLLQELASTLVPGQAEHPGVPGGSHQGDRRRPGRGEAPPVLSA